MRRSNTDESADSLSVEGPRPRRDASAHTAVGECRHCGGNANSLLGGEHIWKCSEVVPKAALKELLDRWRFEYAQAAGSGGYHAQARAFEQCADELGEVLD